MPPAAASSRFVKRSYKPAQCTWSTWQMALALALLLVLVLVLARNGAGDGTTLDPPFRPGPKCTPRWLCMRLSKPCVPYIMCSICSAPLSYHSIHRRLFTPFLWPAHYNKFLACISNTHSTCTSLCGCGCGWWSGCRCMLCRRLRAKRAYL